MRALLDVNVLIGLFDSDHVFHERAHAWLESHGSEGIATCPLTENGLVRILSHPRYSKAFELPPGEVIGRLDRFVANHNHEFWADDISIRDPAVFHREHFIGPRQLTDLYLLGLAIRHKGCLVTFDERVPLNPVATASASHLQVI